MDWYELYPPRGWDGHGHLPCDFDVDELDEDDLLCLEQDLFQASKSNRTVDVGWYPEFDPSGCFVCKEIRDRNWEDPVEIYETTDPAEVVAWLEERYRGG